MMGGLYYKSDMRKDLSCNFTEITDFQAPELEAYARLSENELKHYYEPHGGLFVAESALVTERALAAGYEPVSLLLEYKQAEIALREMEKSKQPAESADPDEGAGVKNDGASTEGVSNAAGILREFAEKWPEAPVYIAPPEVLEQITGYHLARGVLCLMKRKAMQPVEELCRGMKRVAVLEKVMNPTNLGAIFRSAAALGMEAVLLSPGCTDPLYKRSARVSMGTVFQVPWTVLGAGWIEELSGLGFKLAAFALTDDTVSIRDKGLNSEEKLAVVLGSEGPGLAQETIEACDYTIKIPMSHGVDSLNVAAASAVAFWQLGLHD